MKQSCLCGSPWRWTALLPLFIFLFIQSDQCYGQYVPTYVSYDIVSERICRHFHKQEVDAMLDRPVILEMRPGSSEMLTSGASYPKQCNFEVEAKGGFRFGVVSVVQKMSFRSQGDTCIDYIQRLYKPLKGFKIKKKKDKIKKKVLKKVAKTAMGGIVKRDVDEDERGARVCGNVLFGLHVDQNETLPPPFANPLPPTAPRPDSVFASVLVDTQHINPYESLVSDASEVDPKGEMKTHLFVSNRPLRVNEEPIKLTIVYTVYKECDGRNVPPTLFHCGYGLCIHQSLVNDGFVNCPFGDCIDETNCTNAKSAKRTAKILRYVPSTRSTSDGGSGGMIGGLLTFLVVSGAIVCCAVYCFRKRKGQKSETPTIDDDDKGAEFADPSKQPQPSVYYPAQPAPPTTAPAYPPPSGGQPGYYPMVPQQQPPPPGYAPLPQQPGQQPPGYHGMQPQGGYPGQPQGGGGQYPGQAPSYPGYPPVQQQPSGAPGYPPTASDQPPQPGVIGFNVPSLPPGGYPPAPAPGAPSEAPTAPQA